MPSKHKEEKHRNSGGIPIFVIMARWHYSLALLLLCSSCWLLRDRSVMRYRKTDFLLYPKSGLVSSGPLRYNGVYQGDGRHGFGYTRFFPDGRMLTGGCYISDSLGHRHSVACIEDENKHSLYGYFMVRNDTVFMEEDDNVPISSGIQINICYLRSDTLYGGYGFDRSKLKDKKLQKLPRPGDKDVLVFSGKSWFVPYTFTREMKLNW